MVADQTVIVSLVVVAAQGFGAIINNKRYWELRLLMEKQAASTETRLALLEHNDKKITINGKRAPK